MAHQSPPISDAVRARLQRARVARLSTLDAQGRPHIVPICFAFDGSVFYTAIDRKPKRVAPARLARMRHIKATPQVALVIDEYDEDWRQLWWILVRGEAKLMSKSDEKERAAAVRLLRAKYSQYASGMLPREALIIRITPKQITPWGKL